MAMDYDFKDRDDPLEQLRKLSKAFLDKERFFDQLGHYKAAGWPFGRETDAFLLWAQFGQETTVN